MDAKDRIAQRVAEEIVPGSLVNLGIGLPSLVASYVPTDQGVYFQSENGVIGLGSRPPEGMEDPDLTDAGGGFVTAVPGAAAIDSAMSFGLIRGGHIDLTVLGALQVDSVGHLANWMIPGMLTPGMGGAMDLATGAKRVIAAFQHQTRGQSKIVNHCDLPITSTRQVDLIVTDLAVFDFCDTGLRLIELMPDISLDEVATKTEAPFVVAL